MWSLIVKIILGTRSINSQVELKRAMLTGYYAIMAILSCIIYLIMDLRAGGSETTIVFLVSISLLVVVILVNRSDKRFLAKYILLPTLDMVVYMTTSSESAESGAYLFYPVICMGAFTLFGGQGMKRSFIFTFITFCLFISSYFFNAGLLPYRMYDPADVHINFVLNFSISLIALVLLIRLWLDINQYQEKQILEKNELLTKTNSELDRFVYSTSHDLRAPLSSVLGLINITRNTQNPTEVQHYLNLMEARVRSLEFFIKDITDYSRNNRLEINKSDVMLSEIIKEVWDSLRYASDAEGIRLILNFAPETHLFTDRTRLKVVLSNLLSNAIRYHDAGKKEKYIQIGVEQSKNEWQIYIKDNGQGIDPLYHHKIFEMFFRANEKSKGSGLGLYIVKETLSKLGGNIFVESVPHEGTEFSVILPAA